MKKKKAIRTLIEIDEVFQKQCQTNTQNIFN